MQYIQQFINEDMKELMMINDKIDNQLLYDIAKTLKPNHKSRARKTCINIIYKYLFSNDITDKTIDSIDNLFTTHNIELFRDDDDEYQEDLKYRIKMITHDDYIYMDLYPLILIINTLIHTELF